MKTSEVAHEKNDADIQPTSVMVWDPLVRVFHWSLALAFIVAYVTEDEAMAVHVWAGYAAGGLIIFRLFWGVIGTQHARFSDFLFGPVTTLKYLADLVRFREKRYIGHNPAGAVMIFALLVAMAATVWSGLELYAVEENKGPLATVVEQTWPADVATPRLILTDDRDNDDDKKNGLHDFWEETHETLANLTLVLVLIHIGSVVLASFAHQENLVKSMITGKKRPLD